jgi:hypothetical protein
MSVDVIGASAAGVTGAIRQAALRTGADFHYLLATARVESNLNPNAKASSSTAGGLFQFLDQTWLSTLKHAGPALGYGRFADAISIDSSGRFEVADPFLRRQILDLRNDPSANALMAGAFTRWNGEWLAAKLGRPPSEGELYLAHFLGAGGAQKLITLAASSPQASAADLFPRAAGANRAIFYDKQGEPRSVAQVYALVVGRYGAARARSPGGPVIDLAARTVPTPIAGAQKLAQGGGRFPSMNAPLPPLTTLPVAVPAAKTEGAPVFHSLFHTSERREVFAPVVSSLWGPRALSAPQPARANNPTGGGLLTLFHDKG